jgi:hypothetical protein
MGEQIMMYDNFILKLSDKIERSFLGIQAGFNFDYGDEFEVALCRVLRLILPVKYGICRGFVVSSDGRKKGDDIIIFDQERFPTLRALSKEEFSTKEQIPIEAVYAYIEAKHKLTAKSFAKSIQQIIEVKRLCSERSKMGLFQTDPYISPGPRNNHVPESLPSYRNPVFTMIFARYSDDLDLDGNKDESRINSFLRSGLNAWERKESEDNYFPELIVAGGSNFMSTSYLEGNNTKPTLFHLGHKNFGYQIIERKGVAFGIAFAHLMAVIDWIRLGKMPWEEILNESKLFQSSTLPYVPHFSSNKPLEIDLSEEVFINGCLTVQHNLGYTPQVSVLNADGEEVIAAVKMNQREVEICINIHCVSMLVGGKLIIT